MKKKICFVILSRANYGSIKSVIFEFKKDTSFKSFIITGASANEDKFGNVSEVIEKDFKIDFKINMPSRPESLIGMPQTVGSGLIELPIVLDKIKPDLVFAVGDRYETMTTVLSSSYMNIPIAHTMGGEITGTIDESIRHAITKFSHLHFVSNKDAYRRVIRLGENKRFVFNVGCPRNDLIRIELKRKNIESSFRYLNKHGVGCKINSDEKFLILLYHPVTTEFGKNKNYAEILLNAVLKLNIKCLILWPNADSGSDEISKKIRIYREKGKLNNFRLVKNLPPEVYINILNNSKCIVGNSSSAIRDGSFLGVPAVNVGSRQNKRLQGKNVINAKVNQNEILKALKCQIKKNKKYKSEKIYGDGYSAKKILKCIKKIKKINIQKTITY
jgi:UDP-hydrolysing UDP-N-acetyl-D-glucosamine 2-epimerase